MLEDSTTTNTQRNHAEILLRSSQGKGSSAIALTLGVAPSTVSRVRRQFVEHGLDAVLAEKRGGDRSGGETRTISPEIGNEAAKLHREGVSFRELAKRFDFSPEGIRLAIQRRQEHDDERTR